MQVFSRFLVRAQFGSPELGQSNPLTYTGLLQMPNIVATSSRQNTNSLPNTTSAAMRFYEARYVRVSTTTGGPVHGLQRLARCKALPCAKFLERILATRVCPRQLVHAVASLSPSRGQQTHTRMHTRTREQLTASQLFRWETAHTCKHKTTMHTYLNTYTLTHTYIHIYIHA